MELRILLEHAIDKIQNLQGICAYVEFRVAIE